jgi:hypothetical protein
MKDAKHGKAIAGGMKARVTVRTKGAKAEDVLGTKQRPKGVITIQAHTHVLRLSPVSAATALVASSSSQLASPTDSFPETVREWCLQSCHEFYPHIKVRNDWDILLLGSRQYTGSDSDFYAYSDTSLHEAAMDGKPLAQIIGETSGILNQPGIPTGVKPGVADNNIHIIPIPGSEYSLRMWGKGLEAKYEYCLDFISSATHKPINSPFEYELWAIPNRHTPWLPMPSFRIYSIEESAGIAQKDILPGEEKFVLLEGTACTLLRPDMQPVDFQVPVRPH